MTEWWQVTLAIIGGALVLINFYNAIVQLVKSSKTISQLSAKNMVVTAKQKSAWTMTVTSTLPTLLKKKTLLFL